MWKIKLKRGGRIKLNNNKLITIYKKIFLYVFNLLEPDGQRSWTTEKVEFHFASPFYLLLLFINGTLFNMYLIRI